ncbi:transposase [Ghiorsea bivora]|uniref:transposase n=1 Tax=Ghiorsea bivora TaxID=1485545 RepID=UPI00056F9A7A|nr:transposase [Ghiorsea bivora]
MARLPRIVIPNHPLHIMHRGNNKQDIFESKKDMHRIKEDIAEGLVKTGCRLHAYVIMTNHLHLLITPPDKNKLSTFMQTMANRYVRYFNASRHRTGTIWEGRFKSCLIDSETYLFALYRYIEMNPVKAHMAEKPDAYLWSSYRHHALGEKDDLITEHQLYQNLGANPRQRAKSYKDILAVQNSPEQDLQITEATMRGEVYGSSETHVKLGRLISRPTKLIAHGGDRKSKNYRVIQNQAG